MAFTLWTHPDSNDACKARITAQYVGVEVQVVENVPTTLTGTRPICPQSFGSATTARWAWWAMLLHVFPADRLHCSQLLDGHNGLSGWPAQQLILKHDQQPAAHGTGSGQMPWRQPVGL